jgi:hypothetical protein
VAYGLHCPPAKKEDAVIDINMRRGYVVGEVNCPNCKHMYIVNDKISNNTPTDKEAKRYSRKVKKKGCLKCGSKNIKVELTWAVCSDVA